MRTALATGDYQTLLEFLTATFDSFSEMNAVFKVRQISKLCLACAMVWVSGEDKKSGRTKNGRGLGKEKGILSFFPRYPPFFSSPSLTKSPAQANLCLRKGEGWEPSTVSSFSTFSTTWGLILSYILRQIYH